MMKPDRAGPYFIEVAARDGVGAPDRLVIMVIELAGVDAVANLEPWPIAIRASLPS